VVTIADDLDFDDINLDCTGSCILRSELELQLGVFWYNIWGVGIVIGTEPWKDCVHVVGLRGIDSNSEVSH
jgi:hypothetical protein